MARGKARELAFRVLFQSQRGGSALDEVWVQVRSDLAASSADEGGYGDELGPEGLSFADALLSAYASHRQHIDDELEGLIEGWSFGQMAQTDLNILRLAVAEMLFHPDVPPEVSIEMAVRLAKKFGGEESGRFVNGVLAKLFRNLGTDRST